MTEQRHSLQDLHAQTARISWRELEPHFARGVVIRVDSGLDLVEVATCFANDDRGAVSAWIEAGQVEHLDPQTARSWSTNEHDLWAVVVAPWVVVQQQGA